MKKRWTKGDIGGDTVVASIRMSRLLSDRVDVCTFLEERTRSSLLRKWITEGIERTEQEHADNGGTQ